MPAGKLLGKAIMHLITEERLIDPPPTPADHEHTSTAAQLLGQPLDRAIERGSLQVVEEL